ncbi:hypothetical protein ASE64_03310 [Agreia sp. Leaf210]|nr:hypothetical protein ASE64_03310 [Agreia sp. Leaf210]
MGRSDLITVPILVNGQIDESNILLGPTTQIYCTPATQTAEALDDSAKIAELRERIASLHRPITAVSGDSTVYPDFELEY